LGPPTRWEAVKGERGIDGKTRNPQRDSNNGEREITKGCKQGMKPKSKFGRGFGLQEGNTNPGEGGVSTVFSHKSGEEVITEKRGNS